MNLLELFLTFLKIGTVSFGGGYGMISVLQDEVLAHGWLTKEALLDFIAVAESTPGPIAVNMATFVGSSEAGFFGALIATLGVTLPAFLIMLFVAAVFQNLLKYKGVDAFMRGVRPCVAGLITATGFTMLLSLVLGLSDIRTGLSIDWRAGVIFLLIAGGAWALKHFRKKRLSPVLLILASAALGILFYGIL